MAIASVSSNTPAAVSSLTSVQGAQGAQKTGKHHHAHHHNGSASSVGQKSDTAQISDQAKALSAASGNKSSSTDITASAK